MTVATRNYETVNKTTKVASEDIAAFRAVKLGSTEGEVSLCTAITDICIGISTTTASSGGVVEIQTGGVAIVETTAATVAIGAEVMAGASGAGRVATAAGATARSLGVAETASGGTTAGEQIAVRLCVPNLKGPANS